MFIKRNNVMNTATHSVKKIASHMLSGLILCTSAIAPNAFSNPSSMVDKTVVVTFRLSDLNANGGITAVYAKLENRAASFCKSDRLSLKVLDQSVEDCTADLVNQFVDSANISGLSAYHKAQSMAALRAKLALNDMAAQ